MEPISKPAFYVKEVFKECISRVSNSELKLKLEACADELEQDEQLYNQMAGLCELHRLSRKAAVGGVSNDEMKKVYTDRMVNKKSPGRDYYDRLLSSVSICPLCKTRVVSTLDHYLPKDKYSSLVVTPINLIPACSDCNKDKTNKIPNNADELTLHPYFDNVSDKTWLYTRIILSEETPVFDYYVDPPNDWDSILKKRVENHFIALNLKKLYGVHAVQEFNGIKSHLSRLFGQGGISEVRNYLSDIAESWNSNNQNTWKSAMYNALAQDECFLNSYWT